jgi:hypothetical protein
MVGNAGGLMALVKIALLSVPVAAIASAGVVAAMQTLGAFQAWNRRQR